MDAYFSSGAFQTSSLPEILRECAAQKIEQLELSSGIKPDENFAREMAAAKASGLRLLVHNYFPPPAEPFVLNLASTDERVLALSKNMVRAAIELSADFGAPFYSVHSGFALNLAPEQLGRHETQGAEPSQASVPRDLAYRIFSESVAALAEFAHAHGVGLLIENNVVSPSHAARNRQHDFLMTTAEEIVRFIGELNHPALGLLLDVGHAKVSAGTLGFDPGEFVRTVAPHVRGLHLSDNDGLADQNLPFTAASWFCAQLREFSDLPMVIEAYNLSPEQMRAQSQLLAKLLA